MSVSNARFHVNEDWPAWLEITVIGTLAVANGILYISSNDWTLNLVSDYSLYNITIVCNETNVDVCEIICAEGNSSQFVIIDDSCVHCTIQACTMIHNGSDIHNDIRSNFDQIFTIVDEFEQLYVNACDTINNSMTFDIGYPLYGGLFIINDDYRNGICCRGSESCAYSRTIFSNLGNIFCTGEFSCGESESIWTGDYLSSLGETPPVNIFCMAYASCFGAHLESADRIVCGVYFACENAEIEGVQILYCVYDSCSHTIIRQVENAYIYDLQTEMTIFSDILV